MYCTNTCNYTRPFTLLGLDITINFYLINYFLIVKVFLWGKQTQSECEHDGTNYNYIINNKNNVRE